MSKLRLDPERWGAANGVDLPVNPAASTGGEGTDSASSSGSEAAGAPKRVPYLSPRQVLPEKRTRDQVLADERRSPAASSLKRGGSTAVANMATMKPKVRLGLIASGKIKTERPLTISTGVASTSTCSGISPRRLPCRAAAPPAVPQSAMMAPLSAARARTPAGSKQPKNCCWHCYKLYATGEGVCNTPGRTFCSEACAASYAKECSRQRPSSNAASHMSSSGDGVGGSSGSGDDVEMEDDDDGAGDEDVGYIDDS